MTNSDIQEKINRDEYLGERVINKFRFALGIIFVISVVLVSILRAFEGLEHFPFRAYIFTVGFLIYSIIVYFYIRKRKSVKKEFKYICVILDAVIISAAIWAGSTYPEISPPIAFLSIQALFYLIMIFAGSFRYSSRCAYFSGFFSGLCYLILVLANSSVLDLPYYFVMGGKQIGVSFPIYNEFFRVIAMFIAGMISGMASKRHLSLFNNMIESQSSAAHTASSTVEQTRSMAKTIKKSTDEIFLSSKNIFSTANNQAASIQEIESTIKENTQIAGEIKDKTSSVATIASKMENDVISGFSILERNVNQLGNIKQKNDGVITGIITLGNKISKIRDIIKNINKITDQTKVIAFNAALEAASAGDRGKRFAVVASEVNRLADDIASLTRQIKDQVEEIQNSSSSLIISSEESADKITEGNNLIKELEEVFRKIRSGAEITANQAQTITVFTQKQQQSSEHINIAISDISKGLSNFILSTKIATSSAEGLMELTQKLDTLLTSNADINNINQHTVLTKK
ncbi:MAG: methyl-accepting chemotaxis protein [Treponema sp.]|nr:methyl-accepting chemotaxis protein [Treponema sp.]MCL2252062.1 methyl-accepting chemotaxis protein [Treponema sp.]